MKTDNFSQWLNEELKKRNWSIRELGRRSNVSFSWIAKVLRKDEDPSWDFCAAIGPALGYTPVETLLIAGKLRPEDVVKAWPTLPVEIISTEDKLMALIREFPEEYKQALFLLLTGPRKPEIPRLMTS